MTRTGTQSGLLAGHLVVRVVHFAAARGHDPEQLCRSVGLSFDALRAPEARVPLSSAERLGLRVLEVTGDRNLGLHLAQDVRDTGAFDAGVLMMMASATLGVALERMASYQRFWGDGSRVSLSALPDGVRVRYAFACGSPEYQRHSDECMLAEIVLGARVLTAQPFAARVVRFRHAAPDDVSEHTELFGSRLEFAADHTELEFDRRTLDTPLPHADETYRAIFQQQVERALARLPVSGGMIADVRAVARAALSGGDCSLPATARALGVSARTLQRRLQADGTSFEELVDALRRELAAKYLDDQLPIQQIAWLLGYSDASAFHRAFQRWTGTTPEQARAARARG